MAQGVDQARGGINPSWIIVAAGISAALHVGKLPPAVSVLQEQLGISLVQAGFLLSTVQVAGMLLGLMIGLSADRWGLRRSMLLGLFLMVIGSVAGAWATGFASLLALRGVEGLGFLLVAMPGPGLIRRNVSAAQFNARMGWWATYMPTGNAIGLLMGPWVIAHASWQTWWLLTGAASALAWFAIWWFVPVDPPLVSSGNAPPADSWQKRLSQTLHSGGPWLVGASFAAYSCQWSGIIGFLPTVYSHAGLSAGMAGAMTAVVAAANVFGNVAGGKLLSAGWSVRKCLHIGFACMSVCAIVAFAQMNGQEIAPMPVRFLAIVLFSAVGGMIPATLFSTAVRLAPSPQTVSTTVGFMQQLSSVGQFIGPPLLAGAATLAGGWQWTWAVTGSMCLFGWWLANQVARRIAVLDAQH